MKGRPSMRDVEAAFGLRVARSSGAGEVRRKSSPTKAEAMVEGFLRREGFLTIAQPTRLFPLPGLGTYTPDILAWRPGEPGVMVVEVKVSRRGTGLGFAFVFWRDKLGFLKCRLQEVEESFFDGKK